MLSSCDKKTKEKEYYEDGKLKSVSETLSGIKHGYTTIYYENGNVKSKEHFENGVANGRQVSYFPNGAVESIANFSKGKQNGLSILYDSSGSMLSEITFENDLPNGYFRKYINGKKKSEGTFKDGRVVGKYTQYDSLMNKIAVCYFDSLGRELKCEAL